MLYRISKWKMQGQDVQSFKKGLNSRCILRTMKRRPVAVVESTIMDQREVAFRHFTEIPWIDRKEKRKWNSLNPKSKNKNTFEAFLGVPVNKSTVVVVPTCKSTGVAASEISPFSNKLSVGINASASSICRPIIQMKNGDEATCAKTSSNSDRPMTQTMDIDHDPMIDPVIDDGIRRINLKRKALVKKINPIDLLVAMFNDLKLDDKRKIKESENEHFETFHVHRMHARPYAKRMKPLNN